jgi:hypothetical protein
MKAIVTILVVIAFALQPGQSSAQSSQKARGFDYSSHSKMNKKAARWSKRRIKASGNNQLNVQCSVRKSRKAARRAK